MTKVTRIKFDHKSFERWRKKQKFQSGEVIGLMNVISANLRLLEKNGDSSTGLMRKFILEDLDRLRAAISDADPKSAKQ